MLFFLLFIGSLFSQDTALSRTPVMSAETDGYPSYEPQSHLDRDEGAFVWQTLGSIAGAMGGSGLGGIAGFGIAAATGHVGSFPFPFGDWVVYTATGAFVGMLTGATVGAKTFEPRRRRGPIFLVPLGGAIAGMALGLGGVLAFGPNDLTLALPLLGSGMGAASADRIFLSDPDDATIEVRPVLLGRRVGWGLLARF
jgi:hypothetical protein